MKRIALAVVLMVILGGLGLTAATEAAEPRPQGSGFVLRGAVGLGVGSLNVADRTETTAGFAGSAVIGVAGQWWELDLEAAFQPVQVDNPVGRESMRAVYLLPSLRFHADHAYLRLGVGWARYSWSGPQAFLPNETRLGLGAAVGYEFASPRAVPLSVEAYVRGGSDLEEFSSGFWGVQVVASWYSRK